VQLQVISSHHKQLQHLPISYHEYSSCDFLQ